jgi:hypothetical protein
MGEEIPAPPLPDLDLDSIGPFVCGLGRGGPEPKPTVFGRLFILAISLFGVINGLRGIFWETHRLEWLDWWLCLIVLGGALGILRVIVTLPPALRRWSFPVPDVPSMRRAIGASVRAMRQWSPSMQGPPAVPVGPPPVVPDWPRPY